MVISEWLDKGESGCPYCRKEFVIIECPFQI